MFRASGLQSEKLLKKKRKKFLIWLVAVVIILVGIGALSSWLSGIEQLTIKKIQVHGNYVIKSGEVSDLVAQYISGKYLGLFSKANIFIYPKSLIETSLHAAYARIQSLQLTLDASNNLIITLKERLPVALWCGNPDPLPSGLTAACYYVDDLGYIFEQAPQFSNEVYVKYYNDVLRDVSPIGKTFIDPTLFTSLRAFVQGIEKEKLVVTSVTIADGGEYKITVKNTNLDGQSSEGVMYVNSREPLEKTLANLSSFIEEFVEKNNIPLRAFEYIDVRYGNNVIYKFK